MADGKQIDPLQVTNFDRTDDQLQRFWLFCIIVAGKNSDWAASTVSKLLKRKPDDVPAITWLNQSNDLHNTLVANRVGQYTRIENAIKQSNEVDLRTATVQELEGIHGVGPKTARFFVLHTRRDARVAVIDTHQLKWLASHAGEDTVPSQTPQGKKYLEWEQLWLNLTDSYYSGLSKAEADLLIWADQSGRLDTIGSTEDGLGLFK